MAPFTPEMIAHGMKILIDDERTAAIRELEVVVRNANFLLEGLQDPEDMFYRGGFGGSLASDATHAMNRIRSLGILIKVTKLLEG